jgi:hypothetical protein
MFGPRGTCTDTTAWAGVRTILIPPGIVAVQRRSPLSVKKRTPWRPHPDGEVMTARAGGREWFSDHLFVEADQGHPRAAYGTSMRVHISCAIVLIIVVLTRPGQTPLLGVAPSRVIQAMMPMLPLAVATSSASRSIERSAVKPTSGSPASARGISVVTPVEGPSGVKPETVAGHGDEGGVAGGIAGGPLDGGPSSGPSPSGRAEGSRATR